MILGGRHGHRSTPPPSRSGQDADLFTLYVISGSREGLVEAFERRGRAEQETAGAPSPVPAA